MFERQNNDMIRKKLDTKEVRYDKNRKGKRQDKKRNRKGRNRKIK